MLYQRSSSTKGAAQRFNSLKILNQENNEKIGKDKRFFKNWRPISLLNVDYKIISKVFALRVKNLISSQQTAYVPFRCISESGRLISDVMEMADILKFRGYLVTIDIEKAFDSLEHTFIEAVLKKQGFGPYFIDWIKIFLKDQESCVINGGSPRNISNLKEVHDRVIPYLHISLSFVLNCFLFL